MFAIISYKGNQYKVYPNTDCRIDLIADEKDSKISFSDVMLISDDSKTTVGEPYIKGATVEAEIQSNIAGKKVGVFKFHSKKRYTRNLGHRQKYTIVKIIKINSSVSAGPSLDR